MITLNTIFRRRYNIGLIFFLSFLIQFAVKGQTNNYDVLVYGATPSGIAAAVNAAREGVSVVLLEETDYIGGLTASGLSHTDFYSYESLGGTWKEFMNRVEGYYSKKFGPEFR